MTEQFQKKIIKEFSKGFEELYAEMSVCNREFEAVAKTLDASDLPAATIDDCVKRYEVARRRLTVAAQAAQAFGHFFIELVDEPPSVLYDHIKIADQMIAMCAIPVEERFAAAAGR